MSHTQFSCMDKFYQLFNQQNIELIKCARLGYQLKVGVITYWSLAWHPNHSVSLLLSPCSSCGQGMVLQWFNSHEYGFSSGQHCQDSHCPNFEDNILFYLLWPNGGQISLFRGWGVRPYLRKSWASWIIYASCKIGSDVWGSLIMGSATQMYLSLKNIIMNKQK